MGTAEAAAAAAALAAAAAAAAAAEAEPPAPKKRTRKAAQPAPVEPDPAAAPPADTAPTESIVPPIVAAAAVPPPPPAPPVEPAGIVEPPAAPPPETYAGTPAGGDDGNSGITGLVFVVFLGLGVLALLGGALLGGFFDGGTAEASPTPSAAVSTPTPEPTPEPSVLESVSPSVTPSTAQPTPTPVPPNDDFLARAEVCLDQPTASTCDNDGATNDGDFWVLVSFRHAINTDVIGVTIRDSGGTVQDQGSIPLAFCGASTDCAGYTYFSFGGFGPGDYDVEVTRNGDQVATTAFTVE